jgi:hypothetical protein
MRTALPAVVLLALAVPGAAAAATLDPLVSLLTVAPRYQRIAAPASSAAGMRIERDAETGELIAPASALQPAPDLERSDAGLVVEHLPDGSMRVNLEGRFEEVMLVTRAADGTLVPACVDGPKRAQRRIAAPVVPATVWEDR